MRNNPEDKNMHTIMKVYHLFLQRYAFSVDKKMMKLYNNGKGIVINYGSFNSR